MYPDYPRTACSICAAHATRYFGREIFPLCDNPVCEQALTDELNLVLNEVAATPVLPEDDIEDEGI